MLNLSASYSDADSNSSSNVPNINDVNNNVVNGSWSVTLFAEDGFNQTSNFLGYNFTFVANNLLLADSISNTMNGTWLTGTDHSTPKMIINFNVANGPFEKINEEWRIMSSTSIKIELKHTSGGDGSVDLLTFQKIN